LESPVEQNRFSKNQNKPRSAFICSAHQLTIDQYYRAQKIDSFCLDKLAAFFQEL
jgi:hypothetical protein